MYYINLKINADKLSNTCILIQSTLSYVNICFYSGTPTDQDGEIQFTYLEHRAIIIINMDAGEGVQHTLVFNR